MNPNVTVIQPTITLEQEQKIRAAAYCRVSTDDEDQIKSYNSMIKYYTDLIQKNEE